PFCVYFFRKVLRDQLLTLINCCLKHGDGAVCMSERSMPATDDQLVYSYRVVPGGGQRLPPLLCVPIARDAAGHQEEVHNLQMPGYPVETEHYGDSCICTAT